MAGGTWTQGEKKVRPGFYQRFIAAALAQIQPGPRGVVAIPVKANWGPAKQVVEINSLQGLIDTYNNETSGGFTAYEAIRLALLGSPSKVLGYRLVDGSESVATFTLKDTSATPVDVIRLDTKYPTTRAFNVTVRDNIIDPTNKKEIALYEGTEKLYTFVFAKGDIDNAVNAINNDSANKWIVATKLAAGNDSLADISNQNLTGGNAGTSGIANEQYIEATAAFEARSFNTFALDGISDPQLQTTIKSWVERIRGEGKKAVSYLGGSLQDDQTPETANNRSLGFNYEGVVNVGVSGILDGVTYPSAMVACYVAGLGAGLPLRASMTFHATPFDDVTPRLTNSEIIAGIQAGTLLLTNNGRQVVVEKGINTLTSLSSSTQNEVWKKIKGINILDSIATSTTNTANQNYVGKVLNNADGQAALLSALKNYFETLQPELLMNVVVEPDVERNENAGKSEFYWKWSGYVVDSMEYIYGTGVVR